MVGRLDFSFFIIGYYLRQATLPHLLFVFGAFIAICV